MESTMSPNSMDLLVDCEAAKTELIRGKQLVVQLKATLKRSSSTGDDSVHVLMEEIWVSLNRALNALHSNKQTQTNDQRSPNYNTSFREESVQKIFTSKPFEDHHSWKKYGQKTITGFKYPRCYFKCSLRKDQGCKALKQVQQTEADPTKYQVTYIGLHSCTASLDACSPPDQCLLSFTADTSTVNNRVQNWPVGTSYAVGVESEKNSSENSPNCADSDLMASFFESSFYNNENWST